MAIIRQPSFTGGEISPSLRSRIDLELRRRALYKCRNFIPTREGPLVRRGGFEPVAALTGNKNYRLVPFKYTGSQSYLLVFSDQRIEVYLGEVLKATITTGAYPEASIPYLVTAQVHDIMFVTDGCAGVGTAQGMKVIKRLGDANWTIEDYSPPGHTVPAPTAFAVAGTTNNTAETNNPELKRNWHWVITAVDADGNETTPYEGVNNPFYSLDCVLAGTSHVLFTIKREDSQHEFYRFYRSEREGGPYGFVGELYVGDTAVGATKTWADRGSGPDYSRQPPAGRDPIYSTAPPRALALYQQRLAIGGMELDPSGGTDDYPPQTVWFSRHRDLYSFEYNEPPDVVAEDALETKIMDSVRHEVRQLAPLGSSLLAFTDSGIFAYMPPRQGVFGAEDGYELHKVAEIGASCRDQPVVAGSMVIFIGYHRDEIYGVTMEAEGFRVQKLSLVAAHLFDGKNVVAHGWAAKPYGTYWCVLDDGSLLSATIDQASGIVAWAQHDSQDSNPIHLQSFHAVAGVPEDGEDAVYCVARLGDDNYYLLRKEKEIQTKGYLPRCMDLIMVFNGRNTGTNTLSYNATTGEITASDAMFSAADVGDEIVFFPDSGGWKSFQITSFVSSTVVSVSPSRGTTGGSISATTDWAFARDKFTSSVYSWPPGSRLDAVVDGVEFAGGATVNGSTVNTAARGVDVLVGVSFTSEAVTLDAEFEEFKSRQKKITAVEVEFKKTRELHAGTHTGPLEQRGSLHEGETSETVKWTSPKTVSVLDQTPADVVDGAVELFVPTRESVGGRAIVKVDGPDQALITAISRRIMVGG